MWNASSDGEIDVDLILIIFGEQNINFMNLILHKIFNEFQSKGGKIFCDILNAMLVQWKKYTMKFNNHKKFWFEELDFSSMVLYFCNIPCISISHITFYCLTWCKRVLHKKAFESVFVNVYHRICKILTINSLIKMLKNIFVICNCICIICTKYVFYVNVCAL